MPDRPDSPGTGKRWRLGTVSLISRIMIVCAAQPRASAGSAVGHVKEHVLHPQNRLPRPAPSCCRKRRTPPCAPPPRGREPSALVRVAVDNVPNVVDRADLGRAARRLADFLVGAHELRLRLVGEDLLPVGSTQLGEDGAGPAALFAPRGAPRERVAVPDLALAVGRVLGRTEGAVLGVVLRARAADDLVEEGRRKCGACMRGEGSERAGRA